MRKVLSERSNTIGETKKSKSNRQTNTFKKLNATENSNLDKKSNSSHKIPQRESGLQDLSKDVQKISSSSVWEFPKQPKTYSKKKRKTEYIAKTFTVKQDIIQDPDPVDTILNTSIDRFFPSNNDESQDMSLVQPSELDLPIDNSKPLTTSQREPGLKKLKIAIFESSPLKSDDLTYDPGFMNIGRVKSPTESSKQKTTSIESKQNDIEPLTKSSPNSNHSSIILSEPQLAIPISPLKTNPTYPESPFKTSKNMSKKVYFDLNPRSNHHMTETKLKPKKIEINRSIQILVKKTSTPLELNYESDPLGDW